jgi:HD-like signal output (HDOD) protein
MTTQQAVLTGLAVLASLGACAWLLHRRKAVPHPATRPASHDAHATDAHATGAPDAAGSGTTAPDPSALSIELVRRMQALALEAGTLEAEAAAAHPGHVEVVADAVTVLERIEREPRYTPRRPHLLPQLMQAANDERASHQAIADIIAQDPALAGNLLRIANSAMYRVQHRPLESIERAVARIGTDGIRMIIAAALVQPVMNAGTGMFGRFPAIAWEHTLLSASAASEHARVVERGDAFAAQLLGLLHGLASIIVLRVVRDAYARQPALKPDAATALGLLDTWTVPTARRVSVEWGLGEPLAEALRSLAAPGRRSGDGDAGLRRSLRFGRAAGALVMLRRHHRMSESEALAALEALEPGSTAPARIWQRINADDDAVQRR